MEEKISQELKKFKEDFDFIHKKIGELKWKKATMFYNKKDLSRNEIDSIEEQLENYEENMQYLLDDIWEYIISHNDLKFKSNK